MSDPTWKIDECAVVADQSPAGAWVQGWVFVPANKVATLPPEKTLINLMSDPFERVMVEIEGQDVSGCFSPSELTLNDEVTKQVLAGETAPKGAWFLRGRNFRDESFSLSLGQVMKLNASPYRGELANEDGSISLIFT